MCSTTPRCSVGNRKGGMWQTVSTAAGAMVAAVASSAQWGWDAIFGTVPGWEFETVFGGFVGGSIGCGAILIGLIVFIVTAIALLSIFTSTPASTSLQKTKAPMAQQTGQSGAAPSGSVERSRSDAIAGA